MAGKPDLSVSAQQQQPPGVQNVVVYVSNDNFAQAYAVNSTAAPNVGAGGPGPLGHATNVGLPKNLLQKGPTPLDGATLYASSNGFQQHQYPTVLNGFETTTSSGTEIFSLATPIDSKTHLQSQLHHHLQQHQVHQVQSTDRPEDDGGFVTLFPRCESVRSETAESSCSSLSSAGESPASASGDGVVLSAASGASVGSGDVLVYDNSAGSVNVNVRASGQPLGNLVLAMVPPSTGTPVASVHPPAPPSVTSVTVPLGWKRIVTNGMVIYISPSSTALSSLEQVKQYLMTQGTCKCGLECPLKHDTVFNFDPKVNSKPYTLTPEINTGDLTKLCNHKRKLLTLASQGGGGTPPTTPQPVSLAPAQGKSATPPNSIPVDPSKMRKDGGIKRKKRKVGSYSGVSVSQLLAQREKQQVFANSKDQPQNPAQFQQQTGWTTSPMIPGMQNVNRQFIDGSVNPANPGMQQQFIRYPNQNTQVNRVVPGLPMMVGGSMMIPQQQQLQQIHQQQQANQQHHQQMIYQQIQNSNQQGANQQPQQHIIGPNGQIINVHQQQNQGQVLNGAVNHMISNGTTVITNNTPGGNIVLHQQQQLQQQQQQRILAAQNGNRALQPNMNIVQNSINIQAAQTQQEFNQRLQQQQQNFFPQNIQYQNDQGKIIHQQFDPTKLRQNCVPSNATIFSGYRSDVPPNTVMVSQTPQMMMMTQGPQKTTAWHQNKSNSPLGTMQPQGMMNSINQTVVPIQQVNQNNVYERVPPLHHHTPPPPIWNEDSGRKKIKVGKMSKKQRPYNMDNHQQRLASSNDQHPPCPNIDVRQIPGENNKPSVLNNQYPVQNTSGPSFMEDPSGYLAQQTALLNSTISRQTGVNNCTSYICHSPNSSPQNAIQQQQNIVVNAQQQGIPLPSNIMANTQMKQQPGQIFARSNKQPNQFNQQINLPDSSAVNENGNNPMQCQGCMASAEHYHEQNDNRMHYGKQQIRIYQQSQSRPNSQPSTPNPTQEDNPVTSSTFVERHSSQSGYVPSVDSRPIQGGTVSTSNGSPVDNQNQSEPSPTPSTPTPIHQRNSDTPLMSISISQSPTYSLPNNPGVVYSFSNQITTSNSGSNNNRDMNPVISSVMVNSNNGSLIQVQSQAGSTSSSNVPKLEGYCPHPHTSGSPLGIVSRISGPTPFSVHSGMITTMASGRTVGHNTITSVLAGRASTATVSINSPATVPVTSGSPNPFNSQANALITAAAIPSQSIAALNVSKSPLEMVQSVVSSIQIPHSQSTVVNANNLQHHHHQQQHQHQQQQNQQQISPQQVIKHSPTQGLPPGHILVSSGGQLLMASTGTGNGQGIMAPPPPKLTSNVSPMPPLSASPMITNVTASVTQVIPAVGVAQQVLGQQTVLVNTLPAPFVIQPGVMTVDGMTVGQNMQIPHLVTGNVIQQQIQIDGQQDPNSRVQHHSPGYASRQPALLSPESNKKKGGKKRKIPSQTVASMLHIASQQNSGMVMQQPQQGFSQQGFQMAHSPQGLTTGPIMQALTIMPGKAGVGSQIVMNGQPSANGTFGTQQLITNTQSAPQINLLQPVNLLNGTTGVMQNFPTIQQFIVPNLGGMVMSADGTATLVQDTSNLGMQLQLQNVNGQNVLTPVQNTGNMFNQGQSILAAGPAGMVIRTPGGTQGKIIQQQHSPGAQFLSPNGNQFIMNGSQFNGQLSPLIANVSPTQQVTFSTAPQTVRPNTSMQQEFIQCNQMGQTLMVPCAPAPTITVTTASSQQNTTFVHQNTTIVQQQTTMVSNNPIQNFASSQNNQNAGQGISESTTTLNVDQNFLAIPNDKQNTNQQQHQQVPQQGQQMQALLLQRQSPQSAAMMRHSVSTQTAVNQKLQASSVTTNTFCQTSMTSSAGSPPDTTTHSPLAPGGQSPANADTTTHSIGTGSTDEGLSPSPSSMTGSCTDLIAIQARQQAASMAMVHCISSSEPDSGDLCNSASQSEMDWTRTTNLGYKPEYDLSGGGHAVHISRKPDTPTHMAYVESSMHFIADSLKTQESVVSSRQFDKDSLKRKHSDTLVVMETRHMHSSLQDDEDDPGTTTTTRISSPALKDSEPVVVSSFVVGDLLWGPAHGCPSWPGKLVEFVDGVEGRVLVKWFGGDKAPSEVELTALQTLSEGLDAHHRARKKCRKSRKLNTQLENAIQQAMAELDRKTSEQQGTKTKKERFPEKPKGQMQKILAPAHTIVKGEIAGRLRSSQR